MKELVIISGKGGTGKTSIAASLAALAKTVVLADCDVDAADLHLLTAPVIRRREPFSGGSMARIRPENCTGCGICEKICRYQAIRPAGDAEGKQIVAIDAFSCEGCGLCAAVCPAGAIEMRPRASGEWFISDTRFGPMVHARLGVAEENSGKLVTVVRREASRLAVERGLDLVIIDGPPGIGCPVIASIGGTSLVLIVTEPTVSGLHDLERVLSLARHFGVPAAVCINKCDINPEMADRIRNRVAEENIEVVAELPYDASAVSALMAGKTIVEENGSSLASGIKDLWKELKALLEREADDK
jgi:MinD superfamily P-loop ATPase